MGSSDTSIINLVVQDTTAPDLAIQFIDAQTGQPVTSIPPSSTQTAIEVDLQTADICDPAPVASGFADPVFEVVDGTLFGVQASQGNVDMPVSAVSITATASDASGNKNTDTAVLSIN